MSEEEGEKRNRREAMIWWQYLLVGFMVGLGIGVPCGYVLCALVIVGRMKPKEYEEMDEFEEELTKESKVP